VDVFLDFDATKKEKIKVKLLKHCVTLNFAATVQKFQGRTKDYMLLELNECKFHPSITFNMLLVLLSRVRTCNNLNILPLLNGKQSLDYLRKLRPDPDIAIWRNGFDKMVCGATIVLGTSLNLCNRNTPPKRALEYPSRVQLPLCQHLQSSHQYSLYNPRTLKFHPPFPFEFLHAAIRGCLICCNKPSQATSCTHMLTEQLFLMNLRLQYCTSHFPQLSLQLTLPVFGLTRVSVVMQFRQS
jgi:hypothetical protein